MINLDNQMNDRAKCVFVLGPESSGSKLCARIIAHVLGIAAFDAWDGTAWAVSDQHRVLHRSLPYGLDTPRYPDVRKLVGRFAPGFNLYFVLTTRDITISERSRIERFGKPLAQVSRETKKARSMMQKIMALDFPRLVFSYESLVYLGKPYLQDLYRFLGVESGFQPVITDGNRKRILNEGH
jgi:hypothetical protein